MALTEKSANRKDLRAGIVSMEHRHFATIATIIRSMPPQGWAREQVALLFADQLPRTNPRFDRERFFAACKGK